MKEKKIKGLSVKTNFNVNMYVVLELPAVCLPRPKRRRNALYIR